MQSQPPADVKGVPVSIDAIDPKGGFVHLADVTSDASGTFSYMWKPDQEGKYTVTATFAGSPSYGISYAETAVGVTEALAQPETPEIPTPVDNTPLLYGILAGVIVAIILAVVALFRKR